MSLVALMSILNAEQDQDSDSVDVKLDKVACLEKTTATKNNNKKFAFKFLLVEHQYLPIQSDFGLQGDSRG